MGGTSETSKFADNDYLETLTRSSLVLLANYSYNPGPVETLWMRQLMVTDKLQKLVKGS